MTLTKKEILNLISEGETRKAIDALLEVADFHKDQSLFQEVVMQSAKYKQFKKDERLGIQDAQNQAVALSRINKSLIEVAEKLTDRKISDSGDLPVLNTSKKPRLNRWIGILFVLIAAFSAIGIAGKFLPDSFRAERNAVLSEEESHGPSDTGSEKEEEGNITEAPETAPAPQTKILYDTLQMVLNFSTAGTSILIDGHPASLLENSTLSVKYIKVPKGAQEISLIKGNRKCTRPLYELNKKMYEGQICQ